MKLFFENYLIIRSLHIFPIYTHEMSLTIIKNYENVSMMSD
jgi:hypothetical protein